ncbi:MAG: ATP-dependent helicase [Candidatus Tritonobacter lacicola]|nr:ATP-dependent helicase [Candidatus Tritonobacter lacicola]
MKKKYSLKAFSSPGGAIEYDKELNPQQLEAVTASDGPGLVIAGAGSGKTRIITYRVAYLLERGVKPEHILLLTFTKKAATEMLRRVQALVRVDVGRIWGGTFHHVGNMVLRKHAGLLGLKSNYTILDREDSRVLMESAVREEGIDIKAQRFPRGRVLLEVLSYARNTTLGVKEAVEEKCDHFLPLLSRMEGVFKRYERRKNDLNYLDFDDLLLKFDGLLTDHPEVADLYGRRFRHILVDEYQDTNPIQAKIVDRLAAVHKNLMVVGDDSQSIYSFRGALFKNIRDFPKRYTGCRVYTVETNYRSTPDVLELTNKVLEGADTGFHKVLRAVRAPGAKPVVLHPVDVYEQAVFVTQRILELRDEGIGLGQIGILYRSHYHSMELQMELTRRDIPFTVRSGLRFFEQAHIKDVLSYLKIVDNPGDELAWKRVLTRLPRVGPRSAQKIWELIAASSEPFEAIKKEEMNKALLSGAVKGWNRLVSTMEKLRRNVERGPAELIGMVMESEYGTYLKSKYPNYQRRVEDLRQLANYALRYDDVEVFLSDLAMVGGMTAEDIYFEDRDDEMVVLSTVHQSKGLEWPVVFVLWLAEGRFPAAPSYGDPEAMEEERRLFYVAATRCRDELYLLHPLSARQRDGMEVILRPSRFVEEIPEAYYDVWDIMI